MTEPTAVAFWSYARIDDERSLGKITRLASLVAMEYGLITGNSIEIFVDRSDLKWGEVWRNRIDEALQSTTFFIPIVTPTYFQREECRKELWAFHSAARSLGVDDMIMPIIYQRVQGFDEDNPNDAIALVATMHSEFFDEVRLEDEETSVHRKAVNGLAARLAELTDVIGRRPASAAMEQVMGVSAEGSPSEEPDDTPGLIDVLADLEPGIASWVSTIMEFAPIMDTINGAVTYHTERLQAPENASFARRIVVARELANQLEPPAAELEDMADRYAGNVQRVDPGVRALITLSRLASDGPEKEQASQTLQSVREMAGVSRESVDAMRGFVRTTKQTAALSRDLRPVLARINTAVMNIVDGQSIIDGWDEMAAG